MFGPIDAITLKAAGAIEDEFARGHVGGTAQRKAKVQGHVALAIREAFEHAVGKLGPASKTIDTGL